MIKKLWGRMACVGAIPVGVCAMVFLSQTHALTAFVCDGALAIGFVRSLMPGTKKLTAISLGLGVCALMATFVLVLQTLAQTGYAAECADLSRLGRATAGGCLSAGLMLGRDVSQYSVRALLLGLGLGLALQWTEPFRGFVGKVEISDENIMDAVEHGADVVFVQQLCRRAGDDKTKRGSATSVCRPLLEAHSLASRQKYSGLCLRPLQAAQSLRPKACRLVAQRWLQDGFVADGLALLDDLGSKGDDDAVASAQIERFWRRLGPAPLLKAQTSSVILSGPRGPQGVGIRGHRASAQLEILPTDSFDGWAWWLQGSGSPTVVWPPLTGACGAALWLRLGPTAEVIFTSPTVSRTWHCPNSGEPDTGLAQVCGPAGGWLLIEDPLDETCQKQAHQARHLTLRGPLLFAGLARPGAQWPQSLQALP